MDKRFIAPIYGDGVSVGGNNIGSVAVGDDVFDGTGVFVGTGVLVGGRVAVFVLMPNVGIRVAGAMTKRVFVTTGLGITKGVGDPAGVLVRIISVTISDGSVNAIIVVSIGVLDGTVEGVGMGGIPPPLI